MLFNIVVFLIALGILVFVHEMGHFIAAKMCGVYVDRFSLGMPPRVAGFRWGETDYCIGLLPIGGYVKMAGQEDAPLSDEERKDTYGHVPPERWYNNKTKLQRAFILVAGPAMNIVLAFFVYIGMGLIGGDVPKRLVETRIGQVSPDSPASLAPMYKVTPGQATDFTATPDSIGWKVGDRIKSINGTTVTGFIEIATAAILNKGQEATIEIERTLTDGTKEQYICSIEPLQLDPEIPLTQFGFQPFQSALVDHVLPESPASEQGIQSQDRILQVDGEWTDMQSFSIKIQALETGKSASLLLQRGDEMITLSLTPRVKGSFKDIYFDPPLNSIVGIGDHGAQKVLLKNSAVNERSGLEAGKFVVTVNGDPNIGTAVRSLFKSTPDAQVEVTLSSTKEPLDPKSVLKRTVALQDLIQALTGVDTSKHLKIAAITTELSDATKLQRFDVITHINDKPATVATLQEIQSSRVGETLTLTVERPSVFFGLAQKASIETATLTVTPRQQVGVVWKDETVFQKQSLSTVIPYATSECWKRTVEIGQILSKLFTGGLSPKLLGGPVMIFEATANSARSGIYEFMAMLAMISVNLGIFNLLPLPVLDGGQLTIIGYEAIRRREVKQKTLEIVQQAGVVFILGLMLFVTFNDVSRIFLRMLP